MNRSTDDATLVSNVLAYHGLRSSSGARVVAMVDEELRALGIRRFDVHLAGLASEILETILLCSDRSPAIEDVKQLIHARLQMSSGGQTFVITNDARLRLTDERLTVLSYSAFFDRLCRVPLSLSTTIQQKASHDYNSEQFRTRYQNRRIRVLNNPDTTGELDAESWDANEYFLRWASSDAKRHPIILLGERGSGKTWQLFHVCETLLERHRDSQWRYGPAFYVDLRPLAARSSAYRAAIPLFTDAILAEYANVEYRWGASLVEAFLTSGHTVLCIDGFEEVAQIVYGGEDSIREFFQRVCASLPLGTRFVLACRSTNFTSLDRLLELHVWPDTTVGSGCEVISLDPFEPDMVRAYLSRLKPKRGRDTGMRMVKRLIHGGRNGLEEPLWRRGLDEAIRICTRYPALLAAMVEENAETATATCLLEAALIGNVIAYNLEMAKATDLYERSNSEFVHLGTSERVELLGELVWHLAARGQERLEMDNIPRRIALYFGLDLDVVRKDIRIHTLLEPVPDVQTDPTTSSNESCEAFQLAVRPALGEPSSLFPQHRTANSYVDEGNGAATSVLDLVDVCPIGVTSVSGAFLLAKHIAARLQLHSAVPIPSTDRHSLPALDWLRPIGAVPLGASSAGILRELIDRIESWPNGVCGSQAGGVEGLVESIATAFAECAQRQDFSIFSSSLKYAGHNLEVMGLLTTQERAILDPWFDGEAGKVIRPPERLRNYKLALVPPPPDKAIPTALKTRVHSDQVLADGRPLLIGINEVTNLDFLEFLTSETGKPWRVEEITIAGSGGKGPLSPFAMYANEYFLYFWPDMKEGSPRFRPAPNMRNHPVSYVSWFAAAAFCNWLTSSERDLVPAYNEELGFQEQIALGYRLPSVREWSWAARNGRLDVRFPWDLFPLPFKDVLGETAAHVWLHKWRHNYRTALLGLEKEHVPVLSDPFGMLGVSGMMGNVKEWCHDRVKTPNGRLERPILGSTANLGEASFSFEYGMSLFPENTNPDVGFRVCRPLTENEIRILELRQSRLASLKITELLSTLQVNRSK